MPAARYLDPVRQVLHIVRVLGRGGGQLAPPCLGHFLLERPRGVLLQLALLPLAVRIIAGVILLVRHHVLLHLCIFKNASIVVVVDRKMRNMVLEIQKKMDILCFYSGKRVLVAGGG